MEFPVTNTLPSKRISGVGQDLSVFCHGTRFKEGIFRTSLLFSSSASEASSSLSSSVGLSEEGESDEEEDDDEEEINSFTSLSRAVEIQSVGQQTQLSVAKEPAC